MGCIPGNVIVTGGPWGRELAAEGRICVGRAQARKKRSACCDGSQCFTLLRLSLRDQESHDSKLLKNIWRDGHDERGA